jgi:hypothetical protein
MDLRVDLDALLGEQVVRDSVGIRFPNYRAFGRRNEHTSGQCASQTGCCNRRYRQSPDLGHLDFVTEAFDLSVGFNERWEELPDRYSLFAPETSYISCAVSPDLFVRLQLARYTVFFPPMNAVEVLHLPLPVVPLATTPAFPSYRLGRL